ncbi:hypothetical protein BDB01DRAFT_851563 [Pilobolus umbonatus]|nr:hypothetical protein BDB01DRAFT_851563 [Pilobolus umbonatus]
MLYAEGVEERVVDVVHSFNRVSEAKQLKLHRLIKTKNLTILIYLHYVRSQLLIFSCIQRLSTLLTKQKIDRYKSHKQEIGNEIVKIQQVLSEVESIHHEFHNKLSALDDNLSSTTDTIHGKIEIQTSEVLASLGEEDWYRMSSEEVESVVQSLAEVDKERNRIETDIMKQQRRHVCISIKKVNR